jgi:hypothetical protein
MSEWGIIDERDSQTGFLSKIGEWFLSSSFLAYRGLLSKYLSTINFNIGSLGKKQTGRGIRQCLYSFHIPLCKSLCLAELNLLIVETQYGKLLSYKHYQQLFRLQKKNLNCKTTYNLIQSQSSMNVQLLKFFIS